MTSFWRLAASCVLAAIVFTVIAGCSKQPVAIVNGNRITQEEFISRLEQVAGKQVLDDLIARSLIEDAFAKAGLTLSQQEVDAEIESAKSNFPDEAAWVGYLAEQDMTPDAFREMVSFQMKLRMLIEKDVTVTEEDLKKHFEQNRSLFDRPEMVSLSEIVVTSKEEAEKIRSQLNDPQASFGDLARQHSISAYSRERSGRRPEQPLETVQPPNLREAVNNMKVGDISGPIDAQGAWYIIKVDDKQPSQKATYENVSDEVRQHFMYENAKQVPELLEELRKQANVQIVSETYRDLQRMYGDPSAMPVFGTDCDLSVPGAPDVELPAEPAGEGQ